MVYRGEDRRARDRDDDDARPSGPSWVVQLIGPLLTAAVLLLFRGTDDTKGVLQRLSVVETKVDALSGQVRSLVEQGRR